MIFISNFNSFSLLEKYGVPEFTKELSTIILSNIIKHGSYKQITNYEEINDIKYLNIIILNKNQNFTSKFTPGKLNPLIDMCLEIDLPINIMNNWNYIHEIIQHELTHLYEFYNIYKNKKTYPLYNNIKKSLVQTISQDNIDILSYFRYIVYLTLDNELNYRVSQTYNYLDQTKIKDIELLSTSLKNSSGWKKMNIINNFNYKKYTEDIIENIGLDFSLYLINEFNVELINNNVKIPTELINSKEDLLKYFKYWDKKFKYKNRKHKEKLLKLLNNFI